MEYDSIKLKAMERTKEFFQRNNGIQEVKLQDLNKSIIRCKDCRAIRFKLYTKFGGNTYNSKGEMIKSFPSTYNYACSCGQMLVLKEGTFSIVKAKYGCSANKCPENKTKMDVNCLKCQFIYEK